MRFAPTLGRPGYSVATARTKSVVRHGDVADCILAPPAVMQPLWGHCESTVEPRRPAYTGPRGLGLAGVGRGHGVAA